jgi:hypothetical protein
MKTKKFLGIASIPQRKECLIQSLKSVIDQVSEVFVALNGYDSIPPELHSMRNVKPVIMSNSFYGDGGKVYLAGDVEGYYLTLDDDLAVKDGYVDYLCKGVDKYNGVVSLHGKTYLSPITHYKRWAGSYRCLGTVTEDVKVNFIGSGCAAWHTDRFKMCISEVKKPNMLDVWLSKCATEQGIPLVVLKHCRDQYISYLNPSGETIWGTTKDYSYHVEIMRKFIK